MSSALFEISSGRIHCHPERNGSNVSPGCEIGDLVSTANGGMEKLSRVYLITVVLIVSLNSIQRTINRALAGDQVNKFFYLNFK